MSVDLERIVVLVPKETKRRFKKAVDERGMKMQFVLRNLVEDWTGKPKAGRPAKKARHAVN